MKRFIHKVTHSSFKVQMMIVLISSISLVAIISSILTTYISSQTIHENFIEQGETITKVFAQRSLVALLYDSQKSAEESVATAISFRNVLKAIILRPNGEVLYQNKNNLPWLDEKTLNLSDIQLIENRTFFQFSSAIKLTPSENDEANPFDNSKVDDEIIGHVKILISKDELNNIVRKIFVVNTFIALSISLVIFFILTLLINRITTPLQNLSKIMRRAEDSELGLRVSLDGAKEVIHIGHAFNTMMSALEDRESSLKQEIHTRKETESALRESEYRFRILTTISPVGVFYTDAKGKTIYANNLWHDLTGVKPEKAQGTSWLAHVLSEDKPKINKIWETAINNRSDFKAEFRFEHEDGGTYWVLGQATPEVLDNQTLQGYVGTLTDITKLRETEEKVRQHQLQLAHFSRLKTVGEMVSGIAHELNQPLAAIVNYIGGSIKRLKHENVSADIIEVMERVEKQAQRAGEIIHKLKDFLKKGNIHHEPVNVSDVIADVLALIECDANLGHITFNIELTEDTSPVLVDKIQLEQVLINLIQNAVEAMISVDSKEKKLSICTYQDEDDVKIEISDTGPGIPDDIKEQIFDPFFTTKATGMGMGLAICESIIQNQNGRITVESTHGKGTRFTITLLSIESCHGA